MRTGWPCDYTPYNAQRWVAGAIKCHILSCCTSWLGAFLIKPTQLLAGTHNQSGSDKDSSDHEECLQHSSIPKAGGLRRHMLWWNKYCSNSWVKAWVKDGFPLIWANPLLRPPPSEKPNHPGARENSGFVRECVADLLTARAVKKVQRKPKVVNPLNVTPKKNGKLRLILDLRHVNDYLEVPKFKLDSLNLLPTLANNGDRMFAIDLAHGYHQVDMRADTHDYLGFEWEGQYYVFTALPFGLASAPWCFTKVMLQVVEYLRKQNIKVLVYLDDFLFIVPPDDVAAAQIRAVVLATFEAAGLTINREKSTLDFVTRLEHLGFVVDLGTGKIEVPEKRWQALQELLQKITATRHVPVKWLSQVTGHAVSMSLALGSVARMFTRHSYMWIDTHGQYEAVAIPDTVAMELKFWQGLTRDQFTGTIWKVVTAAQCVINTDAGENSWGGVLDGRPAQGYFPANVRGTSSTYRELLGVFNALQAFKPYLLGKRVQLLCDNQALERVIPAGSTKPDCSAWRWTSSGCWPSTRCNFRWTGCHGSKIRRRMP